MAASNACPMAVAFSLVSSIWLKMPDMVLCIVSIMVRMLCMVAIIGGNWLEQLRHERVELIQIFDEILQFVGRCSSTPSSESNMDLSDQQMGISKQCGSQ